MSQKINAKNLSYNTELPPFLARLRGQGGQFDNDGPDPILAARRRPTGRHVRTASEEAEDAPIVVDEEGNLVDLRGKEVEGLTQEKTKEDDKEEDGEKMEGEAGKEKEKVAGIGASKKRKVGRIIGSDADDEQGEGNIAKAARDVRRILDAGAKTDNPDKKKGEKTSDTTTKTTGKPAITANKKKAKKIKLSFGDDAD